MHIISMHISIMNTSIMNISIINTSIIHVLSIIVNISRRGSSVPTYDEGMVDPTHTMVVLGIHDRRMGS